MSKIRIFRLRANNNGYRTLNVKERGGYRTYERYRASVVDCEQTPFRVPEDWYVPGTGIQVNEATIFDYLNQVFDCMMKKFTSNDTDKQINRVIKSQLELKKELGQLTKR